MSKYIDLSSLKQQLLQIRGNPDVRPDAFIVIPVNVRGDLENVYEEGLLADEMNVGPTFKRFNGKAVYSGNVDLVVLTSGRMFGGGWLKLFRSVGTDVANRTGRENDPQRRYVNNKPVTDEDG